MVSDKAIHKSFRIHKLYKQNPLEKLFIFIIHQNYTLKVVDPICSLKMWDWIKNNGM